MVRSKCNSEVDSGRNSARAIAPSDVKFVDDKNRRFRALLRVKAVRNDCTYGRQCQLSIVGMHTLSTDTV